MYLAKQIENIKKDTPVEELYTSDAYSKAFHLLKNSNFKLEEIDYSIKEDDQIIANKYPGLFKYRFTKYTNSINYLKGTVYIFNMTYHIKNKDSIVVYNLKGLMPDEALSKKDYDIFKNVKNYDNTWDVH